MIRKGQLVEGIASLNQGHAAFEIGGGRINVPYFKSALAEAMAQLGDVDGALDLIEESIAQVERPDWEERWYFAEILRIKGALLSAKGDLEGAESSYLASLDWARRQQAKSWELRAATSYARLMRDQGRIREAYGLVTPYLRLVHRGLRHEGPKGSQGAAGRVERRRVPRGHFGRRVRLRRQLRAVKRTPRSQWNVGFSADSGPSRGDPIRRAFRRYC